MTVSAGYSNVFILTTPIGTANTFVISHSANTSVSRHFSDAGNPSENKSLGNLEKCSWSSRRLETLHVYLLLAYHYQPVTYTYYSTTVLTVQLYVDIRLVNFELDQVIFTLQIL